jgi:hypothetical protein
MRAPRLAEPRQHDGHGCRAAARRGCLPQVALQNGYMHTWCTLRVQPWSHFISVAHRLENLDVSFCAVGDPGVTAIATGCGVHRHTCVSIYYAGTHSHTHTGQRSPCKYLGHASTLLEAHPSHRGTPLPSSPTSLLAQLPSPFVLPPSRGIRGHHMIHSSAVQSRP